MRQGPTQQTRLAGARHDQFEFRRHGSGLKPLSQIPLPEQIAIPRQIGTHPATVDFNHSVASSHCHLQESCVARVLRVKHIAYFKAGSGRVVNGK